MKISSSAYFAVESLVRLAAYDAKRPCSVEALSHSVGCSESFTEQLMAELCVAGPRQRHLAAGPRLLPEQALHRIAVAEVFRAFGDPHALDDRPFASRGVMAPEIDELGGTDLLWQALNGSILQFPEGISARRHCGGPRCTVVGLCGPKSSLMRVGA